MGQSGWTKIVQTIYSIISLKNNIIFEAVFPGRKKAALSKTDHIPLKYVKFRMGAPNIDPWNLIELLHYQFSQTEALHGIDNYRDFRNFKLFHDCETTIRHDKMTVEPIQESWIIFLEVSNNASLSDGEIAHIRS